VDLYLTVLGLFLNKDIWLKYHQYIDLEFVRGNYPEIFRLFLVINLLQEENESGRLLDLAAVSARTQVEYPRLDKSELEGFLERVREVHRLGEVPADGVRSEDAVPEGTETEVLRLLEALRDRARASEIAFLALDVADGKETVQKLRQLAFDYQDPKVLVNESKIEEYVTDDLDELYNFASGDDGLAWRLSSLNRSLGPLRKGDFGFVFARPESGKTTFLASEVTFMAGQTESPILWINNEEQGEKVKLRCYEAALGVPLDQVYANRKESIRVFQERTGNRIRIKDDAGLSREQVVALCKSLKPALIVVDQLDKIKGFDADRDDLKLGSIYQWARELAKQFAPVIGICQANGTAEGIKYLNMGHVSNSLTSKQAEADFIIGIGLDYKDPANIRGFSICKNKLLGGSGTKPELRHAKWEVLLDPMCARYKDLKGQS